MVYIGWSQTGTFKMRETKYWEKASTEGRLDESIRWAFRSSLSMLRSSDIVI